MPLERQMGKTLAEIETLHKERYSFAMPYVKDKIVVDAACGCGYGSCMLAGTGGAKTVHGWDRAQEAITHAKSYFDRSNTQWAVRDLDVDPWTLHGSQADVLVSLETIEHLSSTIMVSLLKMRGLLAPGGILVFSHPAHEKGRGNHFHKWFDLDPVLVLNVTKQVGFEVVDHWEQVPGHKRYTYHLVAARKVPCQESSST
jgi:2-polyprenyl-3-methyl-5-hydroxy-6-metoxy-1,4-benzoquinol methylase